jgi:hypothetical protein
MGAAPYAGSNPRGPVAVACGVRRAQRFRFPRPACGERVGVRGRSHTLDRSDSRRGPLTRRYAPTLGSEPEDRLSPRKRGVVEDAAMLHHIRSACHGAGARILPVQTHLLRQHHDITSAR